MTRIQSVSDTEAMKFLVEDFIDLPVEESEADGLRELQGETARILLPGPGSGTDVTFSPPERLPGLPKRYSFQQLCFADIELTEFQALRRKVHDVFRWLVRSPRKGERLEIPLKTVAVLSAGEPGGTGDVPIVEGSGRDIFWFYLVLLINRVGVERIGVCSAMRSKKETGQASQGASCDRLFLRRGSAKEFCSERCRARVATQRARSKRPTSSREGKRGKES